MMNFAATGTRSTSSVRFLSFWPLFFWPDFGLILANFDAELFELAKDSCPSLCGCKLSGAPVEDVERYGAYMPEDYAVITTGHLNLLRSCRLPAVRGAIVMSFEPPVFHPVLDAYYAGRMQEAKELEAYITNSRQPVAALNDLLGDSADASDTAVYCITANKALANYYEGKLGPCRLPLNPVTDQQLAVDLEAEVTPFLKPMQLVNEPPQVAASATRGKL